LDSQLNPSKSLGMGHSTWCFIMNFSSVTTLFTNIKGTWHII
jgi:hypothetical protein